MGRQTSPSKVRSRRQPRPKRKTTTKAKYPKIKRRPLPPNEEEDESETSSVTSLSDLSTSLVSDSSWETSPPTTIPRSIMYHLVTFLMGFFVFLPLATLNFALAIPLFIAGRVTTGVWDWMPKRLYLFACATYRCSGLRGIFTLQVGIHTFITINQIFLALDYIFFPWFRNVQLKSPVFITGIMRSGTTFLHRQLTQTNEFCTWQLWEILFPSITLRCLIKPIVWVIDQAIKRYHGYTFKAYDVGLMSGAHEEALLSHAICAGDFWVEPFAPGFFMDVQVHWLGLTDNDHWRKIHVMHFIECLKRQVYFSGNSTIVAKSPSLTWCLPEIIEAIPDAKILLLVRHPRETLASTLSLFEDTHKQLLDEKVFELNRKNIFGNAMWRRAEQWKRILGALKSDRIRKQCCVVRYEDLRGDLVTTYERCMEHTRLERSSELDKAIESQAAKQRGRKREHIVKDLSVFEIDVEFARILFSNVCMEYRFDWPFDPMTSE